MKTYRITTVITHWNDPLVMYSIDWMMDGAKAVGHRDTQVVVFLAKDDDTAREALKFYTKQFEGTINGRWSAGLEEVSENNIDAERARLIEDLQGNKDT